MSGSKYKCSKCGLPVMVIPDRKPLKICNCDAHIIVSLKAIVKSVSKLENDN